MCRVCTSVSTLCSGNAIFVKWLSRGMTDAWMAWLVRKSSPFPSWSPSRHSTTSTSLYELMASERRRLLASVGCGSNA
jgi:hypothetical protein